MLRASLYIIVCSEKNRIRMRLRRLREPRYLIGAIAGAAYLYFAVFARMTGSRRVGVRRGAGPPPALIPETWQGIVAAAAGVGLLTLAALAWVLPAGSTLLDFSEAETDLLFPAPLTRRQL